MEPAGCSGNQANKEGMAMARRKPQKANVVDGVDFSYLGSKEESAEERTVESRRRLRDMLTNQIEEFLSKGGTIETVPSNITANPPKKPESNYGNRPI